MMKAVAILILAVSLQEAMSCSLLNSEINKNGCKTINIEARRYGMRTMNAICENGCPNSIQKESFRMTRFNIGQKCLKSLRATMGGRLPTRRITSFNRYRGRPFRPTAVRPSMQTFTADVHNGIMTFLGKQRVDINGTSTWPTFKCTARFSILPVSGKSPIITTSGSNNYDCKLRVGMSSSTVTLNRPGVSCTNINEENKTSVEEHFATELPSWMNGMLKTALRTIEGKVRQQLQQLQGLRRG